MRNRWPVASVENKLGEEVCQIRCQGDPRFDEDRIRFGEDGL